MMTSLHDDPNYAIWLQRCITDPSLRLLDYGSEMYSVHSLTWPSADMKLDLVEHVSLKRVASDLSRVPNCPRTSDSKVVA